MENLTQKVKTLSHHPGVYIYKNALREVIYVGKAMNLQKRVRQYFERDDAVGTKTPKLVSEIQSLDTIETVNEFDALLLEAKLIKEYMPKYNVVAKDDKSPLYVTITINEELPRIFFSRKPKDRVGESLSHSVRSDDSLTPESVTPLYFGPFQSARAARNLLRSLRRVVPYCTQKQRTGKKCFYTHLHLCDPCPSFIAKVPDIREKQRLTRLYRSHIFRLRDILSGKAVSVIRDMENEMTQLSNNNHFEEAASLRNQLEALRQIVSRQYDPTVYVQSDTMLEELFAEERQQLKRELQPHYPQITTLNRIECYDISNTMGTYATASMVVMIDGKIDTSEYKKFRMRTKETPNDFAMMAEVITRRFGHPEWEFPDLVVIDGGKGQVGAAKKALSTFSPQLRDLPIIGLAKREEEIIVPKGDDEWKIIRLPYANEGLKLLQRLRDEAHRFAITYHKHLRAKASLSKLSA